MRGNCIRVEETGFRRGERKGEPIRRGVKRKRKRRKRLEDPIS